MTKHDAEREAFENAISELGQPDDEFNQWHLEEGNLYSFWGKAWQAARAQQPATIKTDNTEALYGLLNVIADIRWKTGVGDKPMLSELADVLASKCNQQPALSDDVRVNLQAALDAVDGCEINILNYSHDDACHLNDGFVQLFQAIESALQAANALPTPQVQLGSKLNVSQPKVTREELVGVIWVNLAPSDHNRIDANRAADAIIANWPHIVGE